MFIPNTRGVFTAAMALGGGVKNPITSKSPSFYKGQVLDFAVPACYDEGGSTGRCTEPYIVEGGACAWLTWGPAHGSTLTETTAEVRNYDSGELLYSTNKDGNWTPNQTVVVFLDFKPVDPLMGNSTVKYDFSACTPDDDDDDDEHDDDDDDSDESHVIEAKNADDDDDDDDDIIKGKVVDFATRKCFDGATSGPWTRCTQAFDAMAGTCYHIEWESEDDSNPTETTAEVRHMYSGNLTHSMDAEGDWTPDKSLRVFLDFNPKDPKKGNSTVKFEVELCDDDDDDLLH